MPRFRCLTSGASLQWSSSWTFTWPARAKRPRKCSFTWSTHAKGRKNVPSRDQLVQKGAKMFLHVINSCKRARKCFVERENTEKRVKSTQMSTYLDGSNSNNVLDVPPWKTRSEEENVWSLLRIIVRYNKPVHLVSTLQLYVGFLNFVANQQHAQFIYFDWLWCIPSQRLEKNQGLLVV